MCPFFWGLLIHSSGLLYSWGLYGAGFEVFAGIEALRLRLRLIEVEVVLL